MLTRRPLKFRWRKRRGGGGYYYAGEPGRNTERLRTRKRSLGHINAGRAFAFLNQSRRPAAAQISNANWAPLYLGESAEPQPRKLHNWASQPREPAEPEEKPRRSFSVNSGGPRYARENVFALYLRCFQVPSHFPVEPLRPRETSKTKDCYSHANREGAQPQRVELSCSGVQFSVPLPFVGLRCSFEAG